MPRPSPAPTSPPPRYDVIGRAYAAYRQPDPRIHAQIDDALGDAVTVLNVGAGTGSYEPTDRVVVSVEPSPVMIGQRAPDAAPVVRARAEALPVPDGAFDVVLALLTVHHWDDVPRGLRELRRVAGRQIVLTWDPVAMDADSFWLTRDYVPQASATDNEFAALPEILAGLGPARVEPVPIPHDCRDGFLRAYWRRPEAYLDPDVRGAISALALVDDAVLAPGLERLRADLDSGVWADRNADLVDAETLDLGYRLVVAR
jgi:SAM-dependent methyltransferase